MTDDPVRVAFDVPCQWHGDCHRRFPSHPDTWCRPCAYRAGYKAATERALGVLRGQLLDGGMWPEKEAHNDALHRAIAVIEEDES